MDVMSLQKVKQGDDPVSTFEQLRLLGAAVDEMDEALLITDAQLEEPGPRILFVNQAFTRLTGYSSAEVLGKTPRFLQGERTDRAEISRLRRELAASQYFHGRTYNYRKNGEEFLMDWKISPLRDADGHVTHFIAIQRDASNESNSRADQAALERMDLMGRVAAGIAHDLNNVMTAMMSLSEEVASHAPALSPLGSISQDLLDASEYAAALTNQLIAFSRKQEPRREDVDLGKLLRRTESLLRRLVRKDIDLSLSLPEQECAVRAVTGQIEQIIINLVLNASDAARASGHIRVSISRVRIHESDARRDGSVPGEYALLLVEDDGVGMNEHTKHHLFEPYFTTKSGGKGTGIGLASVEANVRGMNGMVRVTSELNRGSEFRVYIPLLAGVALRAAGAGSSGW